MTTKIQVKRTVGKSTSPGAAGSLEGELAVAFPGPIGQSYMPVLWAFDGTAWQQVNPAQKTAVVTESVDLNTPGGANIGVAAAAWISANQAFAGDVVIGTFGTPAQAYVLIDPANPSQAASWTSLGGAVAFATPSEVHAGVSAIKALSPKNLRGETLAAPTGAAAAAVDANRLIRLDANGLVSGMFIPASTGANVIGGTATGEFLTPKVLMDGSATARTGAIDSGKVVRLNVQGRIDNSMLMIDGVKFIGSVDVRAAPTGIATTAKTGDFVVVANAGTVEATWPGVGGLDLYAGDMLIFDGTNYHAVAQETDLNAYLKLSGGNMADGAVVAFDTTSAQAATGGAASLTIIDGDGGRIDNVVLDGGSY